MANTVLIYYRRTLAPRFNTTNTILRSTVQEQSISDHDNNNYNSCFGIHKSPPLTDAPHQQHKRAYHAHSKRSSVKGSTLASTSTTTSHTGVVVDVNLRESKLPGRLHALPNHRSPIERQMILELIECFDVVWLRRRIMTMVTAVSLSIPSK